MYNYAVLINYVYTIRLVVDENRTGLVAPGSKDFITDRLFVVKFVVYHFTSILRLVSSGHLVLNKRSEPTDIAMRMLTTLV